MFKSKATDLKATLVDRVVQEAVNHVRAQRARNLDESRREDVRAKSYYAQLDRRCFAEGQVRNQELLQEIREEEAAKAQLATAGCGDPSSSRFHGNHQDGSDRAQNLQAQPGHRGTSAQARARRHDDIGDGCCQDCGSKLRDEGFCGDRDCGNDISG